MTSQDIIAATQPKTPSILYQIHLKLFNGPRDIVLTLIIGSVILALFVGMIDWLVISAVWPTYGEAECREETGACWPFLRDKFRLILFGTYPYALQWRPGLASLLIIFAVVISMVPKFQTPWLAILWLVIGIAYFVLMRGGVPGLEYVQPARWNGLPVLLLLAVFGLVFAFPVGIVLALARQHHDLPAIRMFAVGYIELIRGVPMIMVLFLGLFVLPLMMPAGVTLNPLMTTMIALVFFHASYFAEAIRGGLQSIPSGQFEAADSQGLSYAQKTRLIILPQAIKNSMPGIMNNVLGAYKDTSLVAIIGIHDIMATARMAFSDPIWQRYGLEAYLLIGFWYLTTCWCLSSYSRWLERRSLQKS